jgi:hypothetical protein
MTAVKMDEKTPQVVVLDTLTSKVAGTEPRLLSGVTKKRVVVAMSSVLVAVVVVAGILIGVKFFLDSQKDVLQRTLEFAAGGRTNLKEDVTVDSTDNVIEYHVKEADKEVWVIEDYNRDIEITKIATASMTRCFVNVLNGTDKTLEAMKNIIPSNGSVPTVMTHFSVAQKPIKDTSVLGSKGQALCANIDAYWMTPTCDSAQSAASRKKRLVADVYWCVYRGSDANYDYYDCYYIGSV